MRINIPTKESVKKMVDMAVRKEMYRINQVLDRFRKRLNEVEIKIKNEKIQGINRNEK